MLLGDIGQILRQVDHCDSCPAHGDCHSSMLSRTHRPLSGHPALDWRRSKREFPKRVRGDASWPHAISAGLDYVHAVVNVLRHWDKNGIWADSQEAHPERCLAKTHREVWVLTLVSWPSGSMGLSVDPGTRIKGPSSKSRPHTTRSPTLFDSTSSTTRLDMSVNADPRIQLEKEKDIEQIDHHEHVHDANRAILSSAIAAEDQEHMSVLKALKLFPKATFWSFMVSFLIVRTFEGNVLRPDHGGLRQCLGQQHDGSTRLPETLWRAIGGWNLPSPCRLAVGL